VQLYKISCSSFTTLSMLHFVIGWFISCKVVNFASTLFVYSCLSILFHLILLVYFSHN
jgi:hypothetical protein